MIPPIDMATNDDYDLQFGTNVLGHFYFTRLVLPALLSTAKSSSDGTARIVNTSSHGHWSGGSQVRYHEGRSRAQKGGAMAIVRTEQDGELTLAVLLGSISLMVSLGQYRLRCGAGTAVRRRRDRLSCLESRFVQIQVE